MLPEWPLVGRVDELELVERAFSRSDAAGVVLAGAAGVGKTRLARVLLERAAASGRSTAWAQATVAASTIPFGAFAHLLPAQLSEAGPFNLLRVAGDAITERSAGQLVIGIDDAHLLDASSAALVTHLAACGSCFVVATVRSREPVPDTIIRLWKDGPFERIELQTLSHDEVATLLRAVLGHVDASTRHRLWQASQGNPLYLRELLMGGVAGGALSQERGVWSWRSASLATPELTELVETRLADVGGDERRVLEIVAQAEPLEAAFVEALAKPGDLEALERRGLLETTVSDRRRTMRLSHPLYTEALRASTPASLVPVIMHRLAELLTAAGARRAGDLLRLATWRLEAGGSTDIALLVDAGHQAVSLLDFGLAERLARAALVAADGFEARFVLAAAHVGRGRYDEAEALFAELEDRATNDGQRARAALRRNDNLHGPLGRPDDALAVLERARAEVSTPLWRDALLGATARLQLFGGNAIEALTAVEPLLHGPELAPEVAAEVGVVVTWGSIVTGRPNDALAAYTDRTLGAPLLPSGHYATFGPHLLALNRTAAEVVVGNLTSAAQIGDDAYRDSAARGSDSQRAVIGFAYGWVLRVIGHLRTASDVLTDSTAVLREVDFYRQYGPCLGELAYCRAGLGDVAAAETALGEAEARRLPSFVMDHYYVTGARAWVAEARGERSTAREIIREAAGTCGSYGQLTFEAFAWYDLARLGDPRAAQSPLRSLAERVDGELIPTFAAHAAALAAGDAAKLQQVAATFERMGAVLFAAEAAAEAARTFRDEGRTSSALSAAVRARRLADQCEGARTPALDALDASLPLTMREHEIAGLAARGLSNREIADRLVVSVRTVDNHLHSAYTKLGITQRADLAAILFPGIAGGQHI